MLIESDKSQVGNSGSGKTSVVQVVAQLCNKELDVLSVNSAMDTMEILGGFEQVSGTGFQYSRLPDYA